MKPAAMSVLLTGASGGIGALIAEELVRAGARVLLGARSPGPLTALAARLGGAPGSAGRVAALAADITRAADRESLARAAADHGVNVLINNAGAPCFGEFVTMDDTQIAEVMLTNLVAPMQLARALLPQLLAQPEARLLNIGSTLGRLGLPGYAVYGAGKFGLRGFSEALRRELAATGVRVQYLGPRATRTAFNDRRVDAYNTATKAHVDAPQWVARAAVRLLEDGAPERFLGFPEALAVRLNSVFPAWLDRAFGKHGAALREAARLPAA
jgi:short-subunit dehydrogenase